MRALQGSSSSKKLRKIPETFLLGITSGSWWVKKKKNNECSPVAPLSHHAPEHAMRASQVHGDTAKLVRGM